MLGSSRQWKAIRRGVVLPATLAWMGLAGTAMFWLPSFDMCGFCQQFPALCPSTPPILTPTVNAGSDKTVEVGQVTTLIGTVSGGIPPYQTILWQQISGPAQTISGANGLLLSVTGTAKGAAVFQLTVTDAAGTSSSDTATVTVNEATTAPLTVNAGADRVAAVAIGAGGALQLPAGQLLTAIASDPSFPNAELTFNWTVESVPPGSNASAVTILNPASSVTDVLFVAIPGYSANAMTAGGNPATIQNIVVPGDYAFSVTATNPNGDTSAPDTVVRTLVPLFDINPGGTVLQGLAVAPDAQRNHVVAPGGTATFELALLGVQAGTLFFQAEDQSGGDPLDNIALGSEPVVAATPPTITTIMVDATISDPGTFELQASFSGGEASVPLEDVDNAFVHVQRPLADEVDQGELGLIDSDPDEPVQYQGFQSVDADLGIGNKLLEVDIYDNGDPHIISVALGAQTIQVLNQINNANANSANANVEDPGTNETITLGAGAFSDCTGNITAATYGDFDGDGDEDLAVATTDDLVCILWNNLSAATDLDDLDPVFTVDEDGDAIGGGDGGSVIEHDDDGGVNVTAVGEITQLIALNFNGNAAIDLAWGDPTAQGGNAGDEPGVVRVLAGGVPGALHIPLPGNTTSYANDVPSSQKVQYIGRDDASGDGLDDDHAGAALAKGNFSSPTLDDLIVGAPGTDDTATAGITGGGRVIRFAANQFNVALLEPGVQIINGAAGDDLFGTSVVVGDLDGDGDDDLAVGAPLADAGGTDRGIVYLFVNGNAVAIGANTPRIAGAVDNDMLGDAQGKLAVGDVTGDGVPDLIVAGEAASDVLGVWEGGAFGTGAQGFDIEFTGFDIGNGTIIDFIDMNNDGTADLYVGDDSSGAAGYFIPVP